MGGESPSEAAHLGITGGNIVLSQFTSGLFKALPLFVFAYNCQVQFVSYKYNMYNPNTKRVRLMLSATMVFCMIIYMANASGGYLTFCGETLPNLLDSYKSNDDLILPARAALSFVLSCSYPLYSHAIRSSLELTFFDNDRSRKQKQIFYYGSTLLIVGSMTAIAIFFKELDQVLGLTGAIAGSSLVYILPGATFAKVSTIQYKSFTFSTLIGSIFSLLGLVMAIICSVVIFL